MQEELLRLREKNGELLALVESLRTQNQLLNQKVKYLLGRLYGRKSEKIDPRQLELLLEYREQSPEAPEEKAPRADSTPKRLRSSRPRKPRLPEDLPTEDILIDPEEVLQDPEAYECMGEEITQELDVIPPRYFRRRYIRRKWKRKDDRRRAPLLGELPPRLIPGSYASVGLLSDITLKKYVDHIPLYRQEQILRRRYGIELSRKTMCDWIGQVAWWLKPLYNYLREELSGSDYVQIDETPVRYLRAEGGGSGQGYLWVYYHPPPAGRRGGQVVYEWHRSRGAECLEQTLEGFGGTVQCDGYSAYSRYAKRRNQRAHDAGQPGAIELSGCWAHARRKVYEARDEAPALAGWLLNQIGQLYRIESDLRAVKAGPGLRAAIRAAQSRPILRRLHKAMQQKVSGYLPRSQMGEALRYMLGQWEVLCRYSQKGHLEIDNNRVENAIRPSALGKKNWLFFGAPDAGERSAIIYTLLENCKLQDINAQEYLCDVLGRLPRMKIQQIGELTPANWAKARKAKAA